MRGIHPHTSALRYADVIAFEVDNIYWTKEVAEAINGGTLDDYFQADHLRLLIRLHLKH